VRTIFGPSRAEEVCMCEPNSALLGPKICVFGLIRPKYFVLVHHFIGRIIRRFWFPSIYSKILHVRTKSNSSALNGRRMSPNFDPILVQLLGDQQIIGSLGSRCCCSCRCWFVGVCVRSRTKIGFTMLLLMQVLVCWCLCSI